MEKQRAFGIFIYCESFPDQNFPFICNFYVFCEVHKKENKKGSFFVDIMIEAS